MGDEVEWIRARKAHILLIEAGLHPAEFHIRQALRLGKVKSRALHAEIQLRGRYGGKVEHEDWSVPQEVWKGSSDSSAFSLDGDYFSNGDYDLKLGRVKLTGLSFDKRELLDYFEIEPPTPAPTVAPEAASGDVGRGGRSPKVDEWNNLIAAVIVYAQSGEGIDLADQPGAIYRKALDFASALGMDGEAISIDRCSKGILTAKRLIAKAEGGAAALDD
jgi:hypothetical protein